MKNQELQLLYIFDAIMTERSVTRAADRLAMTQPAVSNAISRMRQVWKDPIFVRKGRNIEPTSYALSLWDQVSGPMHGLSNALNVLQFDPGSSRRKFRVAVSDSIVEMVWPQMVELFGRIAPGVDLHVVPYTPEGAHSSLRSASVDLAIGDLTPFDHSLRSTCLFEIGHVLAMRDEHSLAGKDVTLEEYLSAQHLLVSTSGEAHGSADSHLDEKGLHRRIAATVNHYSIVPRLLRESDLIAAIPDFLSQDCGFSSGLWMGRLPFEVDPARVYLIWHTRHDRDPSIIWIREQLERLLCEKWKEINSVIPGAEHSFGKVSSGFSSESSLPRINTCDHAEA